MKRKRILKASSLLATLLAVALSVSPIAFAETAQSALSTQPVQTASAATDTTAEQGWVTKASMSIPRSSFQTQVVNGEIYAIGGYKDGNTVVSSMEKYDPATNTWTTKASMSTPRACFQTEVIGGKIYAIGGLNTDIINTVEEYDPATDTWTTKASMSTKRQSFQTQVINDKIYAIGGRESYLDVSSVEEYDPATDTWTTKASMSTDRSEFSTEVINGKIYAIGGVDVINPQTLNYLSKVEEYDPTTNVWTNKALMSAPRDWIQTEVINEKICAIGGMTSNFNVLSSTEEYNQATNVWTNKASMSTLRYIFQTEVIDEKIYAIGGLTTGNKILSSAEEYDQATNVWTNKASMVTPRYAFQTEVINGKIYSIGGITTDNKVTSSVEAYTVQEQPTLTITPSAEKVKVGQEFTTTIAIHKGSNICAEDMKLTYDTDLFEYVKSESLTGLTICTEDKTTPGVLRFVVASQGIANAATGDKDLIKLTFKAKAPGTGKVDITKGRIADNVSLETDVADENCGEATVTVETSKDVNRSGEVTLLDLGIDAGYYGKDAKDTDTTKYDTDAVMDGVIDSKDLTAITDDLLANANYPMNK